MKKTYLIALAVTSLLVACSTKPQTSPNASSTDAIKAVAITADHDETEIVVGYRSAEDLDEILQALGGGQVLERIDVLKAALIKLPEGLDPSHALGKLASTRPKGLRYAQPNYLHPLPQPASPPEAVSVNDPLEDRKWDHEVMQAQEAWETDVDGEGTKPDGSGVVIAVVDTGIDGTHPDLAGAFVNGYDATGCFTGDTIPPGADATQGFLIHGTHVAGIAAARGNNGQGVAGVAHAAKIMDIKVFCGSYTSDWTIAKGIVAAITDSDGDGIVPDVITMSLGGKGYGQVMKDAVDAALTGYEPYSGMALPAYDDGTAGGVAGDGIPDRTATITVAMANSEQDELFYPAGYPGIIAVGATDPYDQQAYFSTRGAHISVSAPGVDILSTWPTWHRDPTGKPYLYFRISGTSMATPQVAGAVALVKQFLPGASAYEVRRLLESTADDIGEEGFDHGTGWGRINLKKLVDKVAEVIAGESELEAGGTATVKVTTKNIADLDFDGVLGSEGDGPVPLEAVDVQLIRDGIVKYMAKTNADGIALFPEIAPGEYQVLVAGQDITDWASLPIWPYERVSWDADEDPTNGVTLGTLVVRAGSNYADPSSLEATLNTNELTIEISWVGGGDLDLAVYEYDPAQGTGVWNTPKTGGLWGDFSEDDVGDDPTYAVETYTLKDVHYPAEYYYFSIDATNATLGTTVTITMKINGVTKSFGPIPITPGSDAWSNFFALLFDYLEGFDNAPTVY